MIYFSTVSESNNNTYLCSVPSGEVSIVAGSKPPFSILTVGSTSSVYSANWGVWRWEGGAWAYLPLISDRDVFLVGPKVFIIPSYFSPDDLLIYDALLTSNIAAATPPQGFDPDSSFPANVFAAGSDCLYQLSKSDGVVTLYKIHLNGVYSTVWTHDFKNGNNYDLQLNLGVANDTPHVYITEYGGPVLIHHRYAQPDPYGFQMEVRGSCLGTIYSCTVDGELYSSNGGLSFSKVSGVSGVSRYHVAQSYHGFVVYSPVDDRLYVLNGGNVVYSSPVIGLGDLIVYGYLSPPVFWQDFHGAVELA